MPTITYGPRTEARTLCLLRALLLFANWDVENPERFDIEYCWSDEDSPRPKLTIKTNLRNLVYLINQDSQEDSVTIEHIRVSLKQMEFLEILEDHRVHKKGSEEWHFTLTLWSRDLQKNQETFHQEWQRRKPTQSKQQDAEIPDLSTTVHNLPRSGVTKFVGREQTLEILHQQLQETEKVAISSIAGMGGVGKTELALQYAKLYKNKGTYLGGICWLYVREFNVGTQIVGYAQVQGLNIPDGLELKEQVAFCWRNWPPGNVLIVLDDVMNYRDIKPYLPPEESRFKVLMTTRIKFGLPIKVLSLDILSLDQSLELLESLIGQERIARELEIVNTLCEWLGYLPLGLELVGRYLEMESNFSCAEILHRLQTKAQQRQALKDEALVRKEGDRAWISTAQKGVESAFELSWEMLDQNSQYLGKLLSLFALGPIPWNMVEVVKEKYCGMYPHRQEFLAEDMTSSRRQLLCFHLLQEVEEKTYRLHPLIREFFRSKLEGREADVTI